MDYIHLKAKDNWINDPNGFIYFDGMYHLYYQYNPAALEWGNMHWGHAVSKDLIHFEHKDIAIYPDSEFDKNGAFSGNAIIRDGKLNVYYTGICYEEKDPCNPYIPKDGKLLPNQLLVVSDDGYSFDKSEKRVVIPISSDESVMSVRNTRDPLVIYQNGKYIMLLGSTYNDKGKLLVFESIDGYSWNLKKSYVDECFGTIFECPDLFEIDNQFVLICSATDYLKDGKEYSAQTIYKLCKFDSNTLELSYNPESFFVDYGTDLYATQTTIDEYGRRIMIGWMRMPLSAKNSSGNDYIGLFTMPRIVEYKNDHLYMRPHENVVKQFEDEMRSVDIMYGGLELNLVNITIKNTPLKLVNIINDCKVHKSRENNMFRIQATLEEGSVIEVSGYVIKLEGGRIVTDRSRVYPKGNYRYISKTPVLHDGSHVDIYVDDNIIEIFVNFGEYVISNIVYNDL